MSDRAEKTDQDALISMTSTPL